ncbi:MAG: hypothetical protein U0802_21860 [Candidatus Binatia bacterium]
MLTLTLATSQAGYGQALTQGPLGPGAVVDDGSFGGASWFPATNALTSNDLWAQVAPAGSPTHYLKATNYAFSIPSPAQILGIEVQVERHSALGSIHDARARIVKGGVVGATDRSLPGAWPVAPDTTATYGGPSDLWGTTWTPADVNASNFGFALSVTDSTDAAFVDYIAIKVYYSLCATTPAVGCRTAQKSVLVIKDNTTNSKDKLSWKWIKGQTTLQTEFGNPTVDANLAVCVYDNTGLLGEALVGPGANWAALSTKGWKYLDKAATQDGITKEILSGSSSNNSKVLVKGKGINLPDIAPALTLPVKVQLVSSTTGLCWESTFSGSIKNQSGLFKAKAP